MAEFLEPLPTKSDILPNSIATRSQRTVVWSNGMEWIPIYCANCGKDGGMVMKTDWDLVQNYAFYLCDPCAEKWAPLAGMAICPDEAFWAKLKAVQIEDFGRELTPEELVEALKDDEHAITKLAKDRFSKEFRTT